MSRPSAQQLAAFQADLDALYAETVGGLGEREYQHLRRVERWGRFCTVLGYGTGCLLPNPLSSWLIAQGNLTRWAVVAHHVAHRGYDRIRGVPAHHTSRGFARGWRRFWDWPEWMLPEAWSFEHNVLHHYHTGEDLDPDLVERNFQLMRESRAPRWVKYLVVVLLMCTWKFIYYAPNTLWTLQARRRVKAGCAGKLRVDGVMRLEAVRTYPGLRLLNPLHAEGRELWLRCLLPIGLLRFVAVPLAFAPLGGWAVANVFVTAVMAEVLANVHSFLVIVPNHSGEDVLRFEGPLSGKGEFYWRQVTGSVNYTGGREWLDFLQGYLNYQIEHHLFPQLPALTYRDIQPRVRAICERHGVPYRMEPISRRWRRMLAVMVGSASMSEAGAEPGELLNPAES